MELHTKIQSIKKDGFIVDEYVFKFKNIADRFASISELILDKDQLI